MWRGGDEMTTDFDKTMDDLLRQHGRRAMARPGVASSAAGEHLDPDALNAFAENVLPPATRLRYVAHLAACDPCRKLATELALAAGVAFQEEAAAIKPPTVSEAENSWAAWFKAFFSPAVLRFAVPAMALLAVTVGAFVALRPKQDAANEQLARSTESQAAKPDGAAQAQATIDERAESLQTPAAAAPLPAEAANPTPGIPREPAPVGGKAAPATPPLPANEGVSPDTKEERKTAPPAPPPVSETAPPTVELARRQPEDKPMATGSSPAPGGSFGNAQSGPSRGASREGNVALDSASNTDSARERQPSPAPRSPVASGSRGPSKPATKDEAPKGRVADEERDADDANLAKNAKKKAEPASTRSVGGRTFVRRGNAWVDTACNGCSTTTIKRGSDEYKRADAGLRSIADQLGGEVVVIWQGKAYRVQ
jgi:hypothetical protein